ncbi:YbaK/EbsC family protein [Candidatus Bathyarchaeota archaeon]|nr:YbaK/EbsC family protein [Candidatus Bathyarchaeota archaeon]
MKSHLEEYLKSKGVYHRFIPKSETIHTADAASATGIELHRITKNLISVTDRGEHVVLIVPGDRRVNLRKASEVLGVRNVRLLSPEEAEAVSGYPPGGTPSLGYRERVRVIVDDELTELERIFCGGGSRDLLLEVRVEDVIRLNEAIVASISEP